MSKSRKQVAKSANELIYDAITNAYTRDFGIEIIERVRKGEYDGIVEWERITDDLDGDIALEQREADRQRKEDRIKVLCQAAGLIAYYDCSATITTPH